MFTQSVHSLPEVAFPGLAAINPMGCADNPNVDRSAPPRPAASAKKKAAKKKPAKKAVKRR